MPVPRTSSSRKITPSQDGEGRTFSELTAWADVGKGWQHLHGNFSDLGFSIEWHDFAIDQDFDWARSFHPGSVEICLNLNGRGKVQAPKDQLELLPLTAGYYLQSDSDLTAVRSGGDRHQFITIELSFEFLERHIVPNEEGLHTRLRDLLTKKSGVHVSTPIRLTSEHQQMIMSLRRPPVYIAAQRMWYHAKALEVASAFIYQPAEQDQLFCQRQKGQNQERVQKVVSILRENLSEPLSLVEIGRRVGCSHFHLSRIFAQAMGKSIFQYLRDLRLERAAELLREGKLNVTQVAMEVGYSSPSHFSMAFHEAFGCCPGLYSMAPTLKRLSPTRKVAA